MAKELEFRMEFIEQTHKHESDIKLIWSKRSLCEKRLELLQSQSSFLILSLLSILFIFYVMRHKFQL